MIKIVNGYIHVYRLYDIAEEIDLTKVVNALQNSARFQLNSNKNSIFIKESPVYFSLGSESVHLLNKEFESECLCKVWNYGVVSICFKIKILDLSVQELLDLGNFLENNDVISIKAEDKKNIIKIKLSEALKQPADYNIIEDYTTVILTEVSKDSTVIIDPNEAKELIDVSSIILAENKIKLAQIVKKTITENYLQYSEKDLLVLDWNSAVIIDFTNNNDYFEYADLIEFSLSHLLEFRVYDSILDDRLNKLYDSMDKENIEKIDDKTYSEISREAGQIYIEISDVLDRVNNSLKMIGDSFYAKIVRYINGRFRIEDWEKSTKEKLDKLTNISAILQDRVESKLSNSNEKTSHTFEIIVIILILIEILKGIFY